MPRLNVRDKRKQQLMDATIATIAKRGIVDTTITHVSEAANLSRGIINFYFDSKEKMLRESLAYLLAEQTTCWQSALQASEKASAEDKITAMFRAMMSDKLCSVRRLSALVAFLGHAGTHAPYARQLNIADDAFVKQLKSLWQQKGYDAKPAEDMARKMLVIIRGHYLQTFLNSDVGKPSKSCAAWEAHLAVGGAAPVAVATAAKVQAAVIKPAAKKPSAHALPGQMDFADLFAKQ